jgi:biopolymer transport protein ExbD
VASKIIQEGAGDSGEPMGAINVTSLVDVMFCLLIMFMVATPLMSPEGMDVDLPAGRGEEITEEEFFYSIISVDKTGKVFIQGDQNVAYDRIVDVLVALKEAEVKSVGFIADPNMKRLRGSE